MSFSKVGVVGTGVIGEALIGALLKFGIPQDSIFVAEKRDERKREILEKYQVRELASVALVDVVLLAVKPQDLKSTVQVWSDFNSSTPLVLSFAAGVKISAIENFLGNQARVIRVMPNTPMTQGRGISALSFGDRSTIEDQIWVKDFLSTVGKVVVVHEELQDAVTATSGSGPAYFYAFTEAMVSAAKRLGLNESDATILAKETLIGAAIMVEKSEKEIATLRENVTSPNGTTAAALQSFKDSRLEEVVFLAMKAALDRSIELRS